MNVCVPSRLLTTKHVAGSKTRLFHSPLPTTENLNYTNQLITPVPPTHSRTKDPLTAIQLLLNTFETILAPGAFLERPTILQLIMNPIPPPTAGSVGESRPLRLLLPFRTINRHLLGLPGQEVPMTPSPLSNQRCHTPISLLLMTSRLQVRHNHNHNHNPLSRNNTSATTRPMNLRSGTVTGTVDHTRGRTTLWSEMSLTTTLRLPPTNTPYQFHLPGHRDRRRSKRRVFLVVRNEEFTTIRGSVPRRT